MISMTFDLDFIFPIRDVASADLMLLKATCLWNAGIIDDRQRKLVQQRAARFMRGNVIADGNPRTVEMPIQHFGFVLRGVVLKFRRMASKRRIESFVSFLKKIPERLQLAVHNSHLANRPGHTQGG
jgi:hypothetical protein